MAFDYDDLAGLDLLGLQTPDHLLLVVDGLVEGLEIEERLDAFVEQLPVDGFGRVEVILPIHFSDFFLNFLLVFLFLSVGVGSGPPHIA